ncbi:MAG: tRNA (adenosine(37)-N6)-dimethylallyltransferase MiaA [Bacteroidia bacterium]|nr:MAG: tRNA (adenosine(37)-N6)-dimethylallyltransferase MiaA [Bacteroidia bacterium]
MKRLIVITGPTGIGKTDVSLFLAKKLKTEIISADSRQIYKEMTIGTAVPAKEELAEIKHHFIQNKSIFEYYNASMFEMEVIELLKSLHEKYDNIIMAGGSGMYIDAVCKGIDDLPTSDPQLRQKLIEQWKTQGIESLRFDLKKLDPEYYKIVDLKNPKRMLKGLEVCLMTGRTYTSFRKNTVKKRAFEILTIGLELEREEIYNRINQRVDVMMDTGLYDEAKALYKHKERNALNTVGYKEIFAHFDGEYDLEKAVELIKRDSRRYAKRQLAWFKKNRATKWFSPFEKESIFKYVNSMIKENT